MSGKRTELTQEANQRLEALMALRRQALCNQPLPRAISLPQLSILLTLQERGPLTVTDLAHLLNVTAPSASAIADRMEEHGLIERERDGADRRVVHLRVSEQGRTAAEEIVGLRYYQTQRLLSAMTDIELRDLVRGIKAVEKAVLRLQSGDPSINSLRNCSTEEDLKPAI